MGTFALLAALAMQSPAPTPLAPTDATASPSAVNASGLVVGSASVAPGVVHAVEWTDAATFVDLDPGDVTNSSAAAVNAHGDVAGALDDGITSTPFRRLASDGIVTALHSLAGQAGLATASGIDDAGDVVGTSGDAAVVWPAGALDPVALPVDASDLGANAVAVSPFGEFVVGSVELAYTTRRAAAWVSDGAGGFSPVAVAFPSALGSNTQASAVNDAGRIAGVIDDGAIPAVWDPVLDADTGALDSFSLRPLPQLVTPTGTGAGGSASGVSPAGVVVGEDAASDGTPHAVLWRAQNNNGDFVEVDLGPGLAFAVDDALLVVGLAGAGAGGVGAEWTAAPLAEHAPVTAPDDVTAHIGFSDALLVTIDAADPRAVLLNDSDPDGDQLTIVEADTPLTTALGATITFDVDGGFTYVPLDRRPASDFISYTVTDGTLTTQSTLTIDVTDAAPVVVDGAAHFHPSPANSFTYDSTTDVLSFLNLASDADGDPVNVVEAGTTVASAHGSFAVGGDGFFTYQPEQSFVGVDALLVHVTDGLADPVVAGIALAVDDQPPVESAPVVLQFTNGATGNLLENATDADGDSFGAVAATIPTTNGTAIVTADGTVQWQSLTGTPEPVDETFVAELTDFWSTSDVQVTVTFPPATPPFGCGNGPPGTPCADPVGLGFNDCACNASTPADVFTVALLALLLRRGRRNERPSA